MIEQSKNWRECYRHPRKPAIRNCSCCGRPICKECGTESGDPTLCAPCKESLSPVKEKPATGERFEPLQRPAADRDAKVIATEMTVFADGEIRPPEKHIPRKWKKVIPQVTEETREEPDRLPQKPPTVDRDPEKRLKRVTTAGSPEKFPPSKKRIPLPEAGSKDAGKGKAPRKKRLSAISARERKFAERLAGIAAKPARFARRMLSTGTSGQLIGGLPYALFAGVVVFGLWLLLALIRNQWSQFAVLTCGIVVPWALFRGTTLKKHRGQRVWQKPPRPLSISIPSVIIVAGLTVPAEFIAYNIVYRSNPHLPFSDFMIRYFEATGWLLLIMGLALAFFVPFLLSGSESWRKPSIMTRNKDKGESPDPDETTPPPSSSAES